MSPEGMLFLGLILVTAGMWWHVIRVLRHLKHQYEHIGKTHDDAIRAQREAARSYESMASSSKADHEQHMTRWNEVAERGHLTNVQGNQLIAETNQLLRELIEEVRNGRATR